MRIGQLAERTGLFQRTLRCYEEIGVIGRPRRTQSGYRDYEVLGLEAATGGDEEVFRALVLARL